MQSKGNKDLRAQLERLPEHIRGYYSTYFSTLLAELARRDLFFEALSDLVSGYKSVINMGGT